MQRQISTKSEGLEILRKLSLEWELGIWLSFVKTLEFWGGLNPPNLSPLGTPLIYIKEGEQK
jgi:hypothetical protein